MNKKEWDYGDTETLGRVFLENGTTPVACALVTPPTKWIVCPQCGGEQHRPYGPRGLRGLGEACEDCSWEDLYGYHSKKCDEHGRSMIEVVDLDAWETALRTVVEAEILRQD